MNLKKNSKDEVEKKKNKMKKEKKTEFIFQERVASLFFFLKKCLIILTFSSIKVNWHDATS
jgi:hypothetical protein